MGVIHSLLPHTSCEELGLRQKPVLAGPSQKIHTWPCKPWCLHFPPPNSWWHFFGLFPCYIRAALSISGGNSNLREKSQVLPWCLWALDQVLLPSVSAAPQSLAALGQLMAGARPPCWLALSCEQAVKWMEESSCVNMFHSGPLPSAYSRAPWCPFFSVLPCPLCMLLWGRRAVSSAKVSPFPQPCDLVLQPQSL